MKKKRTNVPVSKLSFKPTFFPLLVFKAEKKCVYIADKDVWKSKQLHAPLISEKASIFFVCVCFASAMCNFATVFVLLYFTLLSQLGQFLGICLC